jgi:acetoin utilization protein AcuC
LQRFDFGATHPFKIHRLGLTYDLIEAYGLTEGDGIYTILPREADEDEAKAFHTAGYLETLRLADSGMWVPNLFAHGLGTPDNPVFPGVYEWAMQVAGASIQCAEEILDGRAHRAFNPAGGLHHAMPSRASGFCHVNDAALAIHRLAAAGRRVAYVDIDAHHGDGVQEAFYRRADVLTISVHQSGQTIFPGTGFVGEIGREAGTGYSINVPLLPGAADDLYARAFDEAILPALDLFEPDVIVTQLGADAILGDLVANLRMSLRQFERAVEGFRGLNRPWLALGGGGYDVGNVVRAWTLAWSVIADRSPLPDELPPEWTTTAGTHGIFVSSLRGSIMQTPSTPDHIHHDFDRTIAELRERVFPILRDRSRAS